MAQVLLTHSYFLRFDPKEFRAMMPYPPLGTLYAASCLREKGFDVAFHDVMFAKREDELQEAITRHRPEIVVIYDDQFNYLTKMCLTRMREAAFAMTRIAKENDCTVIIFSSDATDHLKKYFAHGADYVICGEAEETLVELVGALLRTSPLTGSTIRGLASMTNGEIVLSPRRPVLENLDQLPFPAWDLIDLKPYQTAWKRKHGYFSVNMVTTRGCPFHCNWCAKPIYGQVYHTRTPENVVDELLQLQNTVRPDHIWFADDIFGLKPGWTAHFDEVVNARGAKIPFKCLSRVDLLLKEDNIRHLKNAGCQTVWVGAESASQHVLDAMEKGTTVEQIYEATKLLHSNGIRVGFFLQYGYPGETYKDIERTMQMVKECMPDDIGISVSYPLPGTRFYERVKHDLQGKQNWTDSGDLDMMFQGAYSPDFYRAVHRLTHKRFRIWQAKDLLKDVALHPWRTNRASVRRIVASAYHAITLPKLEAQRILSSRNTIQHVMADTHTNILGTLPVAQAFDVISESFDRDLENDITRRIRGRIYETIADLVPPGSSLLDINCGTGIDAIALELRGYTVTGVDISPRMIEVARSKALQEHCRNIRFLHGSFEHLTEVIDQPVQLVLSNFAGLNCSKDLSLIAQEVSRVTSPGGFLLAVVMPRFSLWESLSYALRGQWKASVRRLSAKTIATGFQDKTFVVHYHDPSSFKRAFLPWFEMKSLTGISILSPTPQSMSFYRSNPRLVRWLDRIDTLIGSLPLFRSVGDHYIMVLQRRVS